MPRVAFPRVHLQTRTRRLSCWREHYTGTNFFAFVAFASAFEGALCSGAKRRLTQQWWKDCIALAQKSSIPFRTRDSSESTRYSRVSQYRFSPISFSLPCRRRYFLTTDHNFTDYRHALGAHDHARVVVTFVVSRARIRCAIATVFLPPIESRLAQKLLRRLGRYPRKSGAVFYAKSASNTLLIAL